MSSSERTSGTPMARARAPTRYVPQCDQYTRWRVRTGPPKSSYTGTPSARALRSINAFSIAPIACIAMPPDRRPPQRLQHRHVRLVRPRIFTDERGRKLWMMSVTPSPPNDSLYSLQPTSAVVGR